MQLLVAEKLNNGFPAILPDNGEQRHNNRKTDPVFQLFGFGCFDPKAWTALLRNTNYLRKSL